MQTALNEIHTYFRDYFGNSILAVIYIAMLCWIIIRHEKYRKVIGIPYGIVAMLVFNPLFYTKVWMHTMGYGYWRAFWLFPVAIVIAAGVVLLAQKTDKIQFKYMIVAGLALLIICSGKNVFKNDMFYQKTENAFKLPQQSIDVADALLELEEEPRAVVSSDLYCYIRQYSSKIKLMYGRDASGGYIALTTEDARELNRQLNDIQTADWEYIYSTIKSYNYDYLVIKNSDDLDLSEMKKYPFFLIRQVDGYDIYKVDNHSIYKIERKSNE